MPAASFINNNSNDLRFITIHTLGCHFKYNCRYPEEFKIFRPDLDDDFSIKSVLPNIKRASRMEEDSIQEAKGLIKNIKNMFVNSCDNDICYTTYFLHSL